MQDLRAVMEAADAGAGPADRLELIRNRVRRTRRVQLAAGTAATALILGAVFALVPGLGGRATPAVTMTGSPASGYPQTLQSLPLLKAVKYDRFGKKARLTIVPTGTTTAISFACGQPVRISFEYKEVPNSGLCLGSTPEPNPEYSMKTKVGVPLTLDLLALPENAHLQQDPQHIDKVTVTGPPTSGIWSVGVYSGTCTRRACLPPIGGPWDQTAGMKQMAKAQGIADSQKKTVRFTSTSGRVRLRLVCLDGASWAATWDNGKLSAMIRCDRAEADGYYSDLTFEPGRATDLQLAVFPASTHPVATVAGIAKLMKHPDPMGTWTLQVYDDQN
jgi:hypothetical protein